MRILFVARHYFANPDFVKLSMKLSHKGHQISVATSLRNVDKCLAEKGVSIFEIKPFLTLYSISHSLSFPFSKIYRIVQEHGIDVIHALSDYSSNSALASFVSLIKRVPFVYTIQGVGTRTNKLMVNTLAEAYDWSVERFICGTARKVILLSRILMSRAKKLGVPENNIAVIPSGLDYNYFDPERPEVREKAAILRQQFGISNNMVVTGFVGRLVSPKGLSYLLSALERVGHEKANIVLLLVGDGAQRSYLESVTKRLKIKTIFAGWQSDTAPYYAIMDIFVLPSLFEGLPNVMLEAMSMGKPIVATDVGANADLIENGLNGFLVSVRNPEQIASALEKLIENRRLRSRFGRISREKVIKFFSLDKAVERVERVYNEIV